MEHILTAIVFTPLLGVLALFFINRENANLIKTLGMAFSLLAFVISVFLFLKFDGTNPNMQFVFKILWIESLNISYNVGVDGISLLLVMLTTFLTPLALLSSWNSINKSIRNYVMMMLLLEVGMLGVFVSLDLFLFYVFWEAMLIPMYFIIGIWGGENRIYAAIKFFIYTMFGSLLMLVAIIWLGYYASTLNGGKFTTDVIELFNIAPTIPLAIQTWMFFAFGLSFAIKVPMFPFHTWLPDAHVEAPTAGSVILAGVLLKMGTYGLLRFAIPFFPQATFEYLPYVAGLAVIGIIYGALVAMVQPDIKKLVAYSSVSHLGFVVLGLFALTEEGVQGGIIQMVNHGLSTGALFIIVGMLYDRRHTRLISEYGGISKVMPVFATMFMIVSLSSIGLPGLNGFIGEFLILIGAFKSDYLGTPAFSILAATGVILAAVYILWMFKRVMYGKITNPENEHLKDVSKREIAVLVPIIIFIVWIGVYPSTFLNKSAASTKQLIEKIEHYKSGNQAATTVGK
ncbi:MAG: NADH-quinone oxidoreductase subunit M [Bacteroidota bacterium]|nr:NADH-quinone oxidoreductase subunit M [Bacteroidota bacterium]